MITWITLNKEDAIKQKNGRKTIKSHKESKTEFNDDDIKF